MIQRGHEAQMLGRVRYLGQQKGRYVTPMALDLGGQTWLQRFVRERRKTAESAPTLVASGRTGVSAKAATPLRVAMVTISIIALRSDSGDSARESEAEARPNSWAGYLVRCRMA